MFYRKFDGALDGVTLDELKKTFFDKYYNIADSAETRVESVKKFLDEQSDGFFEDYFSYQYLSKNPKEQVQAESDNVLHFLEVMATFIILGDDDKFPFERSMFAHDL